MTENIEPQLEEDWVKIEYWKCYVIGHRHRSKKAAASCMMKRKGEAGELKKLQRNLSMIECLRKGQPIQRISNSHNCSSPNVIKAVNSTLKKAWTFAQEHGGCPYPKRQWAIHDFPKEELQKELQFFLDLMYETEVTLKELVK